MALKAKLKPCKQSWYIELYTKYSVETFEPIHVIEMWKKVMSMEWCNVKQFDSMTLELDVRYWTTKNFIIKEFKDEEI